MSLCSKLCRLILLLWLLSALSFIALILCFSAYVVPSLYKEYISDSPWDVTSPSVQAGLDRLLNPGRFNTYQLTTYNYMSMLRLSDDQNWMNKHELHEWIYVTGRESCSEDSGVCEKFDQAFDQIAEKYYLHPPAYNASIYTLDCDHSPLLCAAFSVSPPSLIRLESRGPPHCRIAFPSLLCAYEARYIPLPTNIGFEKMTGTFQPLGMSLPDEAGQLRALFESSCAHEVYITQRLVTHLGNFGEAEDWGEVVGDLVAGFPVHEWYGWLFSWWLGESAGQEVEEGKVEEEAETRAGGGNETEPWYMGNNNLN